MITAEPSDTAAGDRDTGRSHTSQHLLSESEGTTAVEISDYLRVIRRRLWILILIPLLAGGAVAALILSQPKMYAATATVAAPALVGGSQTNQYSGANGTKAYVANFTAAVTAPVIVNRVAEETQMLPGKVSDCLSVAPIGESSLLKVTCQTRNKDKAVPVAKAAASDTIKFLFQTQVTLAQRTLAEAQASVTKADADLATFYKGGGNVLPDEQFRTTLGQIASLQNAQATQQAAGNTTAAASLGAQIATLQAKLAQLSPKVTEFQNLTDRKTTALTQLNNVQQVVESARAQAAAANPAEVVSLNKVKPVSRSSALLKAVLPALGAGLFLAVGIVFLLEVLRRRPRPAGQVRTPAAKERVSTGL